MRQYNGKERNGFLFIETRRREYSSKEADGLGYSQSINNVLLTSRFVTYS